MQEELSNAITLLRNAIEPVNSQIFLTERRKEPTLNA